MDGKTVGRAVPGVSAADRKAGHVYMTSVPSMFIVAHVDYVRVVRLLPLGPERTEMSIEFLFLPETLADPKRDLMQRGRVHQHRHERGCRDLRAQSARTARPAARCAGVLMPEEYAIRQFHEWVRAELARA